MQPYKNYWITASTLTVKGYGSEYFACADVCIVEPTGRMIEVKRFQPKEIFSAKEQAEAHGLQLCRE